MIRRLYALRWWMISLITVGTILNYMTRTMLGVAAPTIMGDFGITEKEYSWVTGFFQAGIMLQPIVGYVMDLIGLKLGFGLFALAWGAIMMLHGAAGSWPMLAALRGLMGMAEGSAQPGGMKAVAEWFPAKERGFAGGFYNIGASFGSMLAAPLVAWAILFHSWRLAFVIAGAMALVWVAAWFRFYYSPKDHPRISQQERDLIEQGQEAHVAATAAKPSILGLLRQRNVWGIAIPRLLADPTWGTLSFWVPIYLMKERGFDLKHIALYGWLPWLTADIGCLMGPTIAWWLQKRGVSLVNGRRWAFTFGALLMTGHDVRRHGAGSVHGAGADLSRRVRAPDAVDFGHHAVLGPVPQERGRHRHRHGWAVRQPRHSDVLAADRRTGDHRRLQSFLRGAGGVGHPRRHLALDRGA
jgi:ACS family hexuronate transporter-like MFS transporter